MTVFGRYGYRKTSMDEVARAAGISRQGLYLHFATKEDLFRDMVAHVLRTSLEAARQALADATRPPERRFVEAFDLWHGHLVERLQASPHMAELVETGSAMAGPAVAAAEDAFRAALAEALDESGVAAGYIGTDVSAEDLAATLCAASTGAKHESTSRAAYVALMTHAVRAICCTPQGSLP